MKRLKYHEVADRLAARIQNGDYNLTVLPSERELASQIGASYATARRAVQHLVEQGLLRRLPNGRATPVDAAAKPLQVALLTPAWESATYTRWRLALAQVGKSRQISVRRVLYTHWDDPVIPTTVQSFDGIFLIAEPEPHPETLVSSLRQSGRPIVVLESDWSLSGIRSAVTVPDFSAHRLLEHLAMLGHRQIDYFNVQPNYTRFLQPWRIWLAAQNLSGECIDEPVRPYEDALPAAYAAIQQRIKKRRFKSKALFCTSEAAALGAIAALIDSGLRPGRDVAVCAAEYGPALALHNPSVTSLAAVDLMPYASISLDWMTGSKSATAWPGPLLLQPGNVEVLVRQSTVPGTRKHRALS